MRTSGILTKTWLLAFFLFGTLSALAQTVKIQGTVLDEQDKPIEGVSVIAKQGKADAGSAMTGKDGVFTLSVVKKDKPYELHVTYVGYESYTESNVFAKNDVNAILVRLKRKDGSLDQLVVVGYGTSRKRDLTGSISSVKSSALTEYIVSDPVMALQGRAAGVQVSQNTGAPDGDYTIRIRGINSIKGNNNPLYVIDGIPFSTNTVNAYDIESIDILKDASATAIYGSRGANGVVLITTKRGKAGKTKISYNLDYGIQSVINKIDVMNATEWATFYNDYLVKRGNVLQAPFAEAEIAIMGEGTNWQDLMFNDAAMSNHNLSFSGGAEKVKYYLSASALLREGQITNSNFNKYNVRSLLDFNANPMLDISVQMGYSSVNKMNATKYTQSQVDQMISGIYQTSPLFTPYDENGNYVDFRSFFPWSSHSSRNPVVIAKETSNKTVSNISNVNAMVNFKPLKGLSIRSTLGLEASDDRFDGYTTKRFFYQNNTASISHTRNTSMVNENIISYNYALNNAHNFDLMGGFTYQQNVNRTLAASGNTFASDVTETNNLGAAGIFNTPGTSFRRWSLLSYLGRLNYSFRGKYLATVSIRADGSSRYSANERWGYFPSGALAWRVSAEPFMQSLRSISELKFRTSYGQTGSTAIDPYSTQNLLISGKTATGGGNYTYYAPGSVFPGDLKWETTTQWNVGFDLGLFKNRIQVTGDYYYKFTTDLLSSVSLPLSSGYSSTTKNIGRVDNRGIELAIQGDIIQKKEIGLSAQFNITHNKNEVVELAEGNDIYGYSVPDLATGAFTIVREGAPLGAFYMYKSTGINATGQLTYEDFNKDGKYTDMEDRYIAGSSFPDFTYGFTTNFRYKNFVLNMLLQGSQGNKVFNLLERNQFPVYDGKNFKRDFLYKSWKPGADNSKAVYPDLLNPGPILMSDRFVEDGSYLRLKNISITYNLPVQKWKTGKWLSNVSIYVSAQNVLTFTKYNGLDPEINSVGDDISNGIDFFSYPNNKTYSFGTKIQF